MLKGVNVRRFKLRINRKGVKLNDICANSQNISDNDA